MTKTYTITQADVKELVRLGGYDVEKFFDSLTPNTGKPVAWSVTVGKEYENCIEITHCKEDAVAQYEASTEGGFESIYTLHELFDHPQASEPAPSNIPERDPSKPAEDQGLFHKFNLQRTDGSDRPGGKHHGCEYFVLDITHDKHAPAALRAYAASCAVTHPQLSVDLAARWGAQQVAVPQGWKLVPVDPTSEIIAAAAIAVWPTASLEDIELARRAAPIVLMAADLGPEFTVESLAAALATMAPAYRAMLSAAPQPPQGE